MTVSRYEQRNLIKNDNELYSEHFEKRSVKFINHYGTPNLKFPTPQEISTLTLQKETWKLGDRYYKYAHQYYGDVKMWWVIAWFNQKPTESQLEIGDEIIIPLPLDKVLNYFGV